VIYLGLTVRNGVGLVGVDGASFLWAHHVRVNVISVGTAVSAVAVRIEIGSNIVTNVKGGHHGVLVAFIGVILRAEVVVDKVGIAVVVTS
jgi:hypothetical protein